MTEGLHSLKKLKESHWVMDAVALTFAYVPYPIFRKFYPYSVNIEMTNACVAACTLCNVYNSKRKKGVMKYDDFTRIIDSLPKKVKEIYLNYAGDPLINKDVFKCIKYAHNKGLYVYVSTNAQLLDNFTPKEICESGLNDLAICIDGPTKEIHEFYRKKTDFNRITKAAKKLNDYKKKHNLKVPNTIFQTLVNKNTYKFMKQSEKLARTLGFDEIDYRTTWIPGVMDEKAFRKFFPNYKSYEEGRKYYLFDNDNKYNVYVKNDGKYHYKNARKFCSFYNPMIYWNGDLSVCCNDAEGILTYGNVLKEGFDKAYKRVPRKNICHMKFGLCDTCFKSCYFNIEVKKLKIDK